MDKFKKECIENRQQALQLNINSIKSAFFQIILSNFQPVNEEMLDKLLDEIFSMFKEEIKEIDFLPEYASDELFEKITKSILKHYPDDKMMKVKCLLINSDIGSNQATKVYDPTVKKIKQLLSKTLGDIQPTQNKGAFNSLKMIKYGYPLDPEFRLSPNELLRCLDNGRSYHHSIAGAITGYLIDVMSSQAEASLDNQLIALIEANQQAAIFDKKHDFIKNAKPVLFR